MENKEHKLYTERVPHDTQSTTELIKEALTLSDVDEDAYWEPITVLWRRGTAEILEDARQLCHSLNPVERRLGANILSQLGSHEGVLHDERLVALLEMLDGEADEDVLVAACTGLGHLYDPTAHGALIQLKNHPDEDVRGAVVFGLSGELDETSISALVELSEDEDNYVRDWATFRLGSKDELNVPDIPEALAARLDDLHEGTRCEAIVGLARRKDTRALEPLIIELESIKDGTTYNLQLLLEAATELADRKLCASLLRLRNEGMEDSSLDEALAECDCSLSSRVP
jgi:HEAT repeat protein